MAGVTNIPASDHSVPHTSWWKLVLAGILALLFGVAAILLPPQIMFSRILDVVFGEAKSLSGSMTAVAALLALVALVAIDGLLNLFGIGFMEKKSASWARGAAGIVVAAAAIFWPGITAFVAVELIGLWAVLVGILELVLDIRYGRAEDRSFSDRHLQCRIDRYWCLHDEVGIRGRRACVCGRGSCGCRAWNWTVVAWNSRTDRTKQDEAKSWN